MKEKLFGVFVCILIVLFCFCSCSIITVYKEPEDIAMNYNNINNYNGFWLTNGSICFLDGSLFASYWMVDKNSKTHICSNGGYMRGQIQKYDSKIYILDMYSSVNELISKYRLKVYDINSKTTTTLFSVKNCENFLVIDECVYYLEYGWENDIRSLTLKKYSIDSGEHETIKNQVLSFGVIENTLTYVTKEEGKIVISQYNDETNSSVKCGEFSLDAMNIKMDEEHVTVSYTSSYVLFSVVDYSTETSIILRYSLKNNSLNSIDVEGIISNFISYSTYSYFTVPYAPLENREIYSELYRINNETNEIIMFAEIPGSCSLFVGSDNGAYVLEQSSHVLNYYSNKGEKTIIYKGN